MDTLKEIWGLIRGQVVNEADSVDGIYYVKGALGDATPRINADAVADAVVSVEGALATIGGSVPPLQCLKLVETVAFLERDYRGVVMCGDEPERYGVKLRHITSCALQVCSAMTSGCLNLPAHDLMKMQEVATVGMINAVSAFALLENNLKIDKGKALSALTCALISVDHVLEASSPVAQRIKTICAGFDSAKSLTSEEEYALCESGRLMYADMYSGNVEAGWNIEKTIRQIKKMSDGLACLISVVDEWCLCVSEVQKRIRAALSSIRNLCCRENFLTYSMTDSTVYPMSCTDLYGRCNVHLIEAQTVSVPLWLFIRKYRIEIFAIACSDSETRRKLDAEFKKVEQLYYAFCYFYSTSSAISECCLPVGSTFSYSNSSKLLLHIDDSLKKLATMCQFERDAYEKSVLYNSTTCRKRMRE